MSKKKNVKVVDIGSIERGRIINGGNVNDETTQWGRGNRNDR